jgi:hypothetical protein
VAGFIAAPSAGIFLTVDPSWLFTQFPEAPLSDIFTTLPFSLRS